jgi:beta-lactam-binding protein with PASTA domain
VRRLARLAGLAGAVVVGSGILFLLLLDNVVLPAIVEVPMVTVPDLRERSVAAAREHVSARGLRLTVRDSVFSESVPKGHIVEQAPTPGQRIKRARRVFVDVSQGLRMYEVPDVTGGSQREAGLQIDSYASHSAIPAGVVIRQSPAGGEDVARGTRVDLVVSSGSPFAPKRVPDLIGLQVSVVDDSLLKYEMQLGTVSDRLAELVPPGQILSQFPEPGTGVPPGTTIDLVVSVRRDSTR